MANIKETFDNIAEKNTIIITTEKDAMRIESPEMKAVLNNLPVFYIPIYVEFFDRDKEMFNKIILDYVANA
jgi:tetraacyldisaccharide 4'-kinase